MLRPSSLSEVRALAERMAQSPGDAPALAGRLQELIRGLPPPRSELLTRPHWQRGALWTLEAQFENVDPAIGESPPRVIRCQHDVWIRGVQAIAIVAQPDPPDTALLTFLALQNAHTPNGLTFLEANWRINGKQGFISSGTSEVLAPAALDAGDGFFSAPLDWRLQKDDTIEVRIRARTDNLPIVTQLATPRLRWAVVAFWAEELRQPSVQ